MKKNQIDKRQMSMFTDEEMAKLNVDSPEQRQAREQLSERRLKIREDELWKILGKREWR